MDQATQQNAALVEEMAAAASSLKGQASELEQAVAVFKLGADEQSAHFRPASVRTGKPASLAFKDSERRLEKASVQRVPTLARGATAAPNSLPKPMLVQTAKVAPTAGHDEWEMF
jgi:hypothetical protein